MKPDEMGVRFHMKEMTPEEAAKFLRDLCELTAKNSENWDNMQMIFLQFIMDAMKATRRFTLERATTAIRALGDSDE